MNHYATQTNRREIPICPTCGSRARETKTRYGLRSGCCGLWSWDRYPLVDAATHAARNLAHAAFDSLWNGGKMDRRHAYTKLADALGISPADCHMKLMDAATAGMVPAGVATIKAEGGE